MSNELRERIGDRKVVASISGGKDSAALSLWLKEQGVEHERVFLDVGWEHPDTYAYIRDVLPGFIGPIAWLRGPHTMESLILAHGTFPNGNQRFCTQELKAFVIAAHLLALIDQGEDPINTVGIRREEGERGGDRAEASEWERVTFRTRKNGEPFEVEVWRPLVDFTLDDVIAIHHRHGLPPNPLYLQNRSRVGCRLCVNANKEDIRIAAETDPQSIQDIRGWESKVNAAAANRAQAAGRPIPAERTFFRLREGGRFAPSRIDEAVAWSRTAHGGKQLRLIQPAMNGCMRWGLCDTGTPAPDGDPPLESNKEGTEK